MFWCSHGQVIVLSAALTSAPGKRSLDTMSQTKEKPEPIPAKKDGLPMTFDTIDWFGRKWLDQKPAHPDAVWKEEEK